MAGNSNMKGFVSEINVTPFVDVMLVLLIIFMVTAPMLTEGMDVQLPQTQAVSTLQADESTVVLTIKSNGELFLNDIATQDASLAAQLEQVVKRQQKQLFLKADKEVPYGMVVEIMGRIKAAGIEQIGIVAERIEDTPEGSPTSSNAPAAVRGR